MDAEPSSLNSLVRLWRQSPDEEATIALCGFLGATLQLDLVNEVGRVAEQRYGRSGDVLLAVGRMYLAASMYPAAWRAFAAARRVGRQDPRPFRYLAEILLRQGEARRASELLTRALEHGVISDDILTLNEQLPEYVALERSKGRAALADLMAAKGLTLHTPAHSPASLQHRQAAWMAEDDDDTQVWVAAQRPQVLDQEPKRLASGELPQPAREPLGSAAWVEAEQEEPEELDDTEVDLLSDADVRSSQSRSRPVYAPAMAPAPGHPTEIREDSIIVASVDPLRGQLSLQTSSTVPPAPEGPRLPSPRPPLRSPLLPSLASAAQVATTSAPVPAEALQVPAALIEAPSGEKLRRPTRRSLLVEATLVAALGVLGGWLVLAYKSKEKELARRAGERAELARLAVAHRITDPAELLRVGVRLRALAAMYPDSPQVARLVLRHLVLEAIASGQAPPDLAVLRKAAASTALPARALAVGELLATWLEGPLHRAVVLVRRFEREAARDPYFHLAAGLIFEALADAPAAVKHYRRARELQDQLAMAALLEARALILDRTRLEPRVQLGAALALLGDQPEAGLLRGFSDAAEQVAGDQAQREPSHAMLPRPAADIRELLLVRRELASAQYAAAGRRIEALLPASKSPLCTLQLGLFALDAGRPELAEVAGEKLALIDSEEPGSRILAIRSALLRGELGGAIRALEALAQRSPGKSYVKDRAILHAVVAYEQGQAERLRSVIEQLDSTVGMSECMLGARAALEVMFASEALPAEEISRIALPSSFWAEVVAVDAALDAGDLRLAGPWILRWPGMASRPLHLLRLARLRRYQGRLRESLDITTRLLAGTEPSLRLLLEHVSVMVALGMTRELSPLIEHEPLRASSVWLRVLMHDARAIRDVRAAALPGPQPLELKVLVARALRGARAPRAPAFVEALQRGFPKNPVVMRLEAR